MSGAVIYGLAQTRVTLYASDGVTPTYRVTLQREDKQGLKLSFKAEGTLHTLGSGGNWGRVWNHRGFRPTLEIKWSKGIDPAMKVAAALTTMVETRSGTLWGPAVATNTAIALSTILGSALVAPCLVEPRIDKNFNFKAQPDPNKAYDLTDYKQVAHENLELVLIAQSLSSLPNWPSL